MTSPLVDLKRTSETTMAGEQSVDDYYWQLFVMVISRISELIIIFSVIVPFVPQYLKLKKTGNVQGFSLYVCFILILASILRILFWTLRRFEMPLLIQSFVMITTNLFLVHAYVSTKKRKVISINDDPRLDESSFLVLFDKSQFWDWAHYSSYIYCVLFMTSGLSLVTVICQFSIIYKESIGFVSAFIRACLGVPQLIRNFENSSTAGMSVTMVFMWTFGDTFKFFYFTLRNAPLQFSICALLQILLDIAILGQVVYYMCLSKSTTSPISKKVAASSAQFSKLRNSDEDA